jgi:N-acetylglucosaminyldiphosphoundecaprenol N-acetyl-beta-D-mannosaminyltransferase
VINHFPLGHLKITPGDLNFFLSIVENSVQKKQKSYCIPLNLTKYVVSKSDQKLKRVINSSDTVIADGIPILWLSRRLGYERVYRITGIEFAEAILGQSKSQNWKIFLLGASERNLERALEYLTGQFRPLSIVGHHHGYFNAQDIDQIVSCINSLEPDIIFLGLGMPQKEYFIDDYFHRINASFWLPVGGAFDIWAQTKKRSHPLIQKSGLEWLQRSFYNRKKAKNVLKYGLVFFKDYFFYS